MRRYRRSLVALVCTLTLTMAACADIDANAPGIELADGAGDTVELEDPIGTTVEADTTPVPGTEGSESAEATASIEAAEPLAECGEGEGVAATVINVEEWVRLRPDPSLSGDEVALLPLGSMVTAWPNTLTWDGTDFWWVAAQDPETQKCGYVAGLFLDAEAGRMDSQLQGIAVVVPDGWTLDGRSEHGGPRWTVDQTPSAISVSVIDGDTIDAWIARLQTAITDFIESPDGGGFIAPAEWFDETEVEGADRAVRPAGFPSDDGVTTTVLAQVGDSLVVADSYNYNDGDPEALTAAIEEFLNSLVIRDPAFFGG